MNRRLAFSPAAAADLDHIWTYTAEVWGLDQADRYTDEIRDACLDLAPGIRLGRPVDVRAGYFRQAAGSHVIFFRIHAQRIDVIRILHKRQDVDRNLPS